MGSVVELAPLRAVSTIKKIVDLARKIRGYEYKEGIPRGSLLALSALLKREIEGDSCKTNLEFWLAVAKELQPKINLRVTSKSYVLVRLALTPHRYAVMRYAENSRDEDGYFKTQQLCSAIVKASFN
ncbi:MAG: hypothetical protein Q8P58_01990 [Candidatus Adlerbacteria bacterium]|nr:hypothetical protein [Candidatus Adlerbacteria bacterium]